MPLLWNKKLLQFLPNNFHLANSVLKSIHKKFSKQPLKLEAYDNVINEQLQNNIIQPVENINVLKNKNDISFIAHNAVFRDVETTKCRIVYLSNICEKDKLNNLSHNSVCLPGPNLNNKLDIALILLRFNKYLLIFDLEKAYHQIELLAKDSEKLYFLWFNNIKENDFRVKAYKLLRIPFGVRCSPTILMLALYIILILHVDTYDAFEDELRKCLFNMSYMDNLAYSSNSESDILLAYHKSHAIFNNYKFNLQKFYSNSPEFKKLKDGDLHIENENDSIGDHTTKLLGMIWDTKNDTIYNNNNNLDPKANTLRTILSSVNGLFDPLNIGLPGKNRAKLFLHSLQSNKNISWDTKLDSKILKEYKNICSQYNKSKKPELKRFIGDYSAPYNIIAYTDASKAIYGTVLYLQNVNDNKLHFLCAKNKIISNVNSKRSIPVLELFAIKFGVECINEMIENLTNTFCPLNIKDVHVYSDSMVALNWLINKVQKFDKIEKKGSVINNVLNFIEAACEKQPITFHHCNGSMNPADFVTRCISYKVLSKTNYLTGPIIENNNESLRVTVPNPLYNSTENFNVFNVQTCQYLPLFKLDMFSSFTKICKVSHFVRKFIHNLKIKVNLKNPNLFPNYGPNTVCSFEESCNVIIRQSQLESFQDTLQFLANPTKHKETVLVTQLNLFLDKNKIIRVKSKFANLNSNFENRNPVLLHKNNKLTEIIIKELHLKMKHAGIYKLLSILRKEFYIPTAYSVVKKNIQDCFKCKLFYGRTVKNNQNHYKDYRINPSKVPYREILLDNLGPFSIKINDIQEKVYILIITCTYTRAVNLIVCSNLDNKSFISAFQFHVFDYGVPQVIVCDQATTFISSINSIKNFLNDDDVKNYLTLHNIKVLEFSPYPAKASFLGGLVESLVKQVKFIIYSAIGKNILKLDEFSLLVKEANMLINKRPIAFKSLLINPDVDPSIPFALTPEILVKGYEVPSVVISKYLYNDEEGQSEDPDWSSDRDHDLLFEAFQKYRKVKANLNDLYHEEFLANLQYLATNKHDRYQNKKHTNIEIGDIIAIKEKYCKPYFFQLLFYL
ncbi:UNVERIFIED_CONTAM: hypothetical protein RMT77_016683 [Armadillidium vulgare]